MKSLTLLLLATCAGAASIADIQPTGADPVRGWFDYDQDNFALGDDDGYTAGLRLGYRYDSDSLGPWTLIASWCLYTKRMPPHWTDGLRSDELTITAQHEAMFGPVFVNAGMGVLFAGNLGGASVQNEVHHVFGDQQFDLTYEDDRILPLIAATARWTMWQDVSAPSPLGRTASALDLRGGLLMHQEEVRAQIGLALSYTGETGGVVQIEPTIEVVTGDGASESARSEHWFNPGIQGHLFLGAVHIGMTVTADLTYGTLGLRF